MQNRHYYNYTVPFFLFKWINFSMSHVQNKVSFLNSAQSMFCDRHQTSVVQPDNNRVQVCETDDCNYCAPNNSIYKGNRYKSKNFREKFRSSRKLQMWSKTNCGVSNKLQQSEKDQRGKIESTSEWKWNGRFRFLLHFSDSGSLLGLMSMKHSHSLLHLFNSATSHQVNILCCTWHKRDHFKTHSSQLIPWCGAKEIKPSTKANNTKRNTEMWENQG